MATCRVPFIPLVCYNNYIKLKITRRSEMFDLKEKIFEKYNESDKKKSLEQFRSENVKYINDNIRNVIYDSLSHTYSEMNKGQFLNLIEIFDSVRISWINKTSFDVIIDKQYVREKQMLLKQGQEIYNVSNLITQNIDLTERDLELLQVRLEDDIQNFINTKFMKYLGK